MDYCHVSHCLINSDLSRVSHRKLVNHSAVMSGDFQVFPDLPARDHWSPDVLLAHEILQRVYQQATQLLRQEEGDPLHL